MKILYCHWLDEITSLYGSKYYKTLPHVKYFIDKNYSVDFCCGNKLTTNQWKKLITSYDICIVYNGSREEIINCRFACEQLSKKTLYFESGFLPQDETVQIDPQGIIGKSSLCKDISWVSQTDINEFKYFQKEYVKDYIISPQDYILIPTQMEWDCSIKLHSPFLKMTDFIKHCEEKFENEKIIYKIHPRDFKNYKKYKKLSKNKFVMDINLSYKESNDAFMKLASKAKLVYGINSTSLYQSLILGVPTISIGEGIILSNKIDNKSTEEQITKVLTAVYKSQYFYKNGNVEEIMNRILI